MTIAYTELKIQRLEKVKWLYHNDVTRNYGGVPNGLLSRSCIEIGWMYPIYNWRLSTSHDHKIIMLPAHEEECKMDSSCVLGGKSNKLLSKQCFCCPNLMTVALPYLHILRFFSVNLIPSQLAWGYVEGIMLRVSPPTEGRWGKSPLHQPKICSPGKIPPSRLPPQNFYSPHQRLTPPTK